MRRIQRTYKREKGKGKNQNNISVCIKAFSFRALKQSFEAFSGTEMIWLRLLLKGANTLCCRCLGWSCKPRQMPKLLFTSPCPSAKCSRSQGLKGPHRVKGRQLHLLHWGSWGSTFLEKQASLLQRHFPKHVDFLGIPTQT